MPVFLIQQMANTSVIGKKVKKLHKMARGLQFSDVAGTPMVQIATHATS